eukprot:2273643-Amphidinium_carterae.1
MIQSQRWLSVRLEAPQSQAARRESKSKRRKSSDYVQVLLALSTRHIGGTPALKCPTSHSRRLLSSFHGSATSDWLKAKLFPGRCNTTAQPRPQSRFAKEVARVHQSEVVLVGQTHGLGSYLRSSFSPWNQGAKRETRSLTAWHFRSGSPEAVFVQVVPQDSSHHKAHLVDALTHSKYGITAGERGLLQGLEEATCWAQAADTLDSTRACDGHAQWCSAWLVQHGLFSMALDQ